MNKNIKFNIKKWYRIISQKTEKVAHMLYTSNIIIRLHVPKNLFGAVR